MRTTETASAKASLQFLYNTAVGRILLRLLLCRPASALAGKLLDNRVSCVFIKRFISKNNIDMTDYEDRKFSSFNDFFTRRVKEGTRPIDTDENSFISPCDARLSVFPIEKDSIFRVKGVDYTVRELLRYPADFTGGYCMIFRLSVDNYHRYCWPVNGTAEAPVHIKGKYHTVQPISLGSSPVFRENTREYTVIHSEKFGDVVQMEVGAMLVGRICNNPGNTAVKGAEKGRFEFGGSTIILITEKDRVDMEKEFLENTEKGLETLVKYGEKIGAKRTR